MISKGIYDECLQFRGFLEHINEEIEKEMQNLTNLEDDESEEEDDENDEVHGTTKGGKRLKYSKSSLMLQYIKKYKIEASFPNLEVALRVLESIPVCNATGERSFSSLKRIKGPQRSTLTQKNLNDMAMLFINNDILQKIDIEPIINRFAAAKARKVAI